jgi:hypothetical protein
VDTDKSMISHRGAAFRALREYLEKLGGLGLEAGG